MSLHTRLQSLKKNELIQLIKDIASLDPAVEEMIHALIKPVADTQESESLFKDDLPDLILHELDCWQNMANDRRPRRSSASDLQALHRLLDQISTLSDQLQAFKCIERFLQLQHTLFARMNDSDGMLLDLFGDAADLWLDIATRLRKIHPQSIDWQERVTYHFEHNPFGCLDQLLPNSGGLLSVAELQQLAWRFEKDLRASIRNSNAVDDTSLDELSTAMIGLQSVGMALKDFSLVEKSVLLSGIKPNDEQLTVLVHTAIALGSRERAEYWLRPEHWQMQQQRQEAEKLLQVAQAVACDADEIWHDFERDPETGVLLSWWERVDEETRKARQPVINKHIRQHSLLSEAVDMAIVTGNYPLAAEIMIQQDKDMDRLRYAQVHIWREVFEYSQYWLAAALCYRILIDDILRNSRTAGYAQAAGYLLNEQKLAKRIKRYAQHPNDKSYLAQLKDQHGRKKSFWKHVPGL
ncbi:DUF6880 family protein [Parathalassolituus penaei]|uniref:Uncharacterized protein n=1 Tax=Parathalassolituus penaei TaxID=2997323 RepID=A0A9X3EFA0_9GAMM|nr:DUF6880 family protein [Parathalassolituus penaei]MCY0965680.1 hypothetical protein [Parathalassolituus penaei]